MYPCNFGKIFLTKADLRISMKEECCKSDHYQQPSFRYFVNSFLISKLLSKVFYIQMGISRGTLKHGWVNWAAETIKTEKNVWCTIHWSPFKVCNQCKAAKLTVVKTFKFVGYFLFTLLHYRSDQVNCNPPFIWFVTILSLCNFFLWRLSRWVMPSFLITWWL